jgi:hypothetical protein
MRKQDRQHLEGLPLKPNSSALLAQFAGAKIQFEDPKTKRAAKLMVFWHGEVRLAERECSTGQTLRNRTLGIATTTIL